MPAARYWRLVGIDTYGGGELELSEIQLYSGSARVDTGAIFSCTHTPASGVVANLSDADIDTTASFSTLLTRAGGFAFVWDFGVGQSVDALRIGAGSAKARYPESLQLQYSSGNGFWSPLFGLSGIVWAGAFSYVTVRDGGDEVFWSDLGLDASTLDTKKLVYRSLGLSRSAARAGVVLAGKKYWELTIEAADVTSNGNAPNFGVWPTIGNINDYIYNTTGVFRAYGAFAVGDVFGFAYDADTGVLAVDRNGIYVGGAKNQPLSTATSWSPVVGDDNAAGLQVVGNFGSTPFSRTPPLTYSGIASPGTGYGTPMLRTSNSRSLVAASATHHNFSARSTGIAQTARDIEFGGNCAIAGFVKEKGTPNQPVRRRVRLLRDRDALLVRETWSDAATGAFVFSGIDGAQAYTAFAQDHTGNFRAVVADRLTAEVPV